MSRRWREASMRWIVFVVAAWWLLSGAAASATAWDLASNAGKNSIRAQVARAFAESRAPLREEPLRSLTTLVAARLCARYGDAPMRFARNVLTAGRS